VTLGALKVCAHLVSSPTAADGIKIESQILLSRRVSSRMSHRPDRIANAEYSISRSTGRRIPRQTNSASDQSRHSLTDFYETIIRLAQAPPEDLSLKSLGQPMYHWTEVARSRAERWHAFAKFLLSAFVLTRFPMSAHGWS